MCLRSQYMDCVRKQWSPRWLAVGGYLWKKYYFLWYEVGCPDYMWSSHILNICNKTRRLVGMMYRKFYKHSSSETLLKLCISSHLEYACIVWDPYLSPVLFGNMFLVTRTHAIEEAACLAISVIIWHCACSVQLPRLMSTSCPWFIQEIFKLYRIC